MDIEFGLNAGSEGSKEGYTCPVFLHKDESRCDRYFVTHFAGVHTVNIGCMEDLQRFVVSESSSKYKNGVFVEFGSVRWSVDVSV